MSTRMLQQILMTLRMLASARVTHTKAVYREVSNNREEMGKAASLAPQTKAMEAIHSRAKALVRPNPSLKITM